MLKLGGHQAILTDILCLNSYFFLAAFLMYMNCKWLGTTMWIDTVALASCSSIQDENVVMFSCTLKSLQVDVVLLLKTRCHTAIPRLITDA